MIGNAVSQQIPFTDTGHHAREYFKLTLAKQFLTCRNANSYLKCSNITAA